MIYISLLKRKVGGNEQNEFSEDSLERTSPKPPTTTAAPEKRRSSPTRIPSSIEGDDNSDWFSSSNGSVKSFSGDPPVPQEAENLLSQTITESVSAHIPLEKEDDDESNVSILSGSVSQVSVPTKKEHIEIDISSQEKLDSSPHIEEGDLSVSPHSPHSSEDTPLGSPHSESLPTSSETLQRSSEALQRSVEVLQRSEEDESLNVNDLRLPSSDEKDEETELKSVLKSQLEQERVPLHTVSTTVNRSNDSFPSLLETKQRIELENRKREFQEEMDRQAKLKKEEEEGDTTESVDREGDRSQESTSMEEIYTEGANPNPLFGTLPPNFYPGLGAGVPIVVMPGQASSPEMMMLLQALRQARHEANFHDKETNGPNEESVPKLHNLLNLDEVDDLTPSVTPQTSHRNLSSQNGAGVRDSERLSRSREPHSTGRTESSVQFKNVSSGEEDEQKQGKRGILEVVSETIEPRLEYYDLSRTNISENEKRRFPRVNITEPLREKMKKASESPRERSKERKSPERSSGYRSRSLTPGSGYDEEQTMPKSILKDRSRSPLDSISPERRDRLLKQSDDIRERSPSSSLDRTMGRNSPRSPRSSLERSPRTSTDRLSGRDWSPRSPRIQSPDRFSGNDLPSSAERSPRSPLTPRSPRTKSPLTNDILEEETSPGRSSRDSDPNKRLVRVLNRELELLKLKMDVLEKSNLSDNSELQDVDTVTKRLSEQVQDSLSRSPKSRSPLRQRSHSPEYTRGRMFRKKPEDEMASSRSRSDSRPRTTVRIEEPELSSGHKSHSLQDLSISEAADGKISFAPTRKGKPISLGYSSPIRKVSEEIWGMNSTDNVGYDPEKISRWKKLVKKPRISEQDVLELKQALATSIAENDILQAKLKNANTEIDEKMSKTNEVLNDCRSHLAKTQAENMELRTQLEKEKTRNDTLESRTREFDKQLANAKSHSDELESQIEQLTTLLHGASKKDIPTLQSLAEERDNYKGVLSNTQRQNTQLKEDLVREKKLTGKQQNMINDLKNILDDARQERQQMFTEITRLQKQGKLTKVSGIINRYIDQGLYDDEDEEEPMNGYVKGNHGSKTDSFYLTQNESYTHPRARVDRPKETKVTSTPIHRSRSESLGLTRKSFDDSLNTPSRSASFNVSGIEPVTRSSSNARLNDYDYEKNSPALASHEIYPHRRSNSFRNNFSASLDGNDDDDLMDDLEVQKYLSKQPVGKIDYEKSDSFVQHTPRKDFRRANSPNTSKSPLGRGLSFSDLNEDNRAKKQLMYSPYLMNKEPNGVTSRKYANHSPYDNTKETVECIVESPVDNRFKDDYKKYSTNQRPRYGAPSPENDKNFLKALEYAVQQESNSIQKIYDELDLDHVPTRQSRSPSFKSGISRAATKSPSPTRNGGVGLKGILKNAKSETNLSIKEGRTTPRSFYSHSASPVRSPTKDMYGSRYVSTDFSPKKSSTLPTPSGKHLYSGAAKRPGLVRNSQDFYDDAVSPQPSTFRYQHQPFNRRTELGILIEQDVPLECEICRARYQKLRYKNYRPRIQHKITKLQNDVCRHCEISCRF